MIFMTELKYLQEIYEKAPEKLKGQPAFIVKLKEIEKMIDIAKPENGYQFTSYNAEVKKEVIEGVTIKNDVVEVFLSSTYGENGYTVEQQTRNGWLYSIYQDKDENLVFELKTIYAKKKSNTAYPNVSFHYEGEVIRKGTEEIVEQRKTGTLQDEEITEMDFLTPPYVEKKEDMTEEERQKNIVAWVQTHNHRLERSARNLFGNREYRNWYDWKAKRDPSAPKTAWCSENFIINGTDCHLFDVKANIVGPFYDSMRIDSHYDFTNNINLGGVVSPSTEEAKKLLDETGYYNFGGKHGRH